MVTGIPSPGIYSATYSGIPVYEYQFGGDCKEHVMRRRHDDWINATHILKAAGFDKPARTRILERDVQKDVHEKIQGGYGKYQGTWIPLEAGEGLARRHSIYDRIRPIFEFVPGNESPPPAPRHANKPKAPKVRPPLPKWNSANAPAMPVVEEYDPPHEPVVGGVGEEDTPDNVTVASASFMAEDDRFEGGHAAAGHHRKRKREEQMQDLTEQQHAVYGDELLDYFLLSRNEQPAVKPDPPPNFQPNWLIDAENHTALHWASAMGDIDVIKQLRRFSADVAVKNIRGETPFMRSVNFTNCYEKQSFPAVMKELFETVDARDTQGCTVIHHAAIMKNGRVYSPSCSRYYLDNILNRLQETFEPGAFQRLLDVQDSDGNTALHLAAQRNARKCIRALLGRNASTDIANNEGVRAEDLIMELNAVKKDRGPQRSSSPFAPDSHKQAPSCEAAFADGGGGGGIGGGVGGAVGGGSGSGHGGGSKSRKWPPSFQSAAATTVQTRISPLIMEKFQDLAQSYDDEWREKDLAEMEAKRLLANTQAELAAAHQQMADLEAQLEPDDVAAKISSEANLAKHQVLSLIMHQNKLHIHQIVETEMSRLNGDGGKGGGGGGGGGDASAGADGAQQQQHEATYEERLALARQLNHMLAEQRDAELEYVDALSMVGVGDKIEKYRRLLKLCLDPKDGEILDSNLDNLIEMMEEEKDIHDMDEQAGGERMDFAVTI